MKIEHVLQITIDHIGQMTAIAIEHARDQGKSEEELREILVRAAQQFREQWTGRMLDKRLDAVLAELPVAIERHREALAKRVN